MTIAGVQLAIFAVISFSKFSHVNRFWKCPIRTLTAEAANSDT